MEGLQSQVSAQHIEWFSSPETTPKNTAPCEALAIFVGKNYKAPALFLDIGSALCANARYLRQRGHRVITVDSATDALAMFHEPIDTYLCGGLDGKDRINQFDCIYDINTICHVKGAPYPAIYRALKLGGKFFSIHPASDTEVDMAGKGYTRLATRETLVGLLKPFGEKYDICHNISWAGDPKIKIASWQIEATK